MDFGIFADILLSVVHQQDLSIEEKVLRLFDVSSQYGVSVPNFLVYIKIHFKILGERGKIANKMKI